MNTDRLTDKEFEVLLYFIMQNSPKPIVQECKDGENHFLAYPAKIEKDLRKKISRVWAANICKKFEENGILGHEDLRPPRQKNLTEHYFLKSDHNAIIKAVKAIVETANARDSVWILGQSYFHKNINESLVKKILFQKNVVINRILDIWYWNPVESQKLYKEIGNFEIFKNSIDEKDNVADVTTKFDNKRENVSFKEYVHRILKYQFETKTDGMSFFFPTINLRLPVFADETSEKEQMAVLENLNKDIFGRYPLLKSNRSGIEEHYKHWQHENLILPILALIKASPKALAEFLYGDWKPYGSDSSSYICYSPDGIKPLEYPLFKILFIAISDIAITRSIPEGVENNVDYVLLRPNKNYNLKKENSLLLIAFNNFYQVYFDAGFSTHEDYIGVDLIKIPDENYYWVKFWIEIRPSNSGFLLDSNCINDYNAFIEKIISNRDKISNYIYNKFSNVIKNILNNIDLQNSIHKDLQKKILYELNLIILNNNLYEDMCKLIKLSDYTTHEHDAYINILKHYNKSVVLSDLVELNYSVLEDIFPEQIIKRDYRVEIENFEKGEGQK